MTLLYVKLWGGGGSGGTYNSGAGFAGGGGGFTSCTLAVTPGQTINILVAGGYVYLPLNYFHVINIFMIIGVEYPYLVGKL